MRFVRFLKPGTRAPHLGVVIDDRVLDLSITRLPGLPRADRPDRLLEAICRYQAAGMLHAWEDRLHAQIAGDNGAGSHDLTEIRLLAPVQPRSLRDFYAFEAHVRNARARRGLPMPPEWYDAPVFYFSNTAGVIGPGAPVRKPPETRELDYELEVAVLIGREGADIPVEEADGYIAGCCVLNDWSARDLQRHEMKVGLGPAKGKDFATSIGPWLVTPEALEPRVVSSERGRRYDLTMTASVNGQEYSRGSMADMRWTFAELIARASRNTRLLPGDLIGSGTVGTGCITEFPEGTYPWLHPGDVVTLEVELLGVLENRIVA